MLRSDYKTLTETGVVATGEGYLIGILVGTDGVNDPELTVHDNIEASGTEIIPTTTIDASGLGFNGFLLGAAVVTFDNGLYLTVSAAGAKEVVFYYRLKSDDIGYKVVR